MKNDFIHQLQQYLKINQNPLYQLKFDLCKTKIQQQSIHLKIKRKLKKKKEKKSYHRIASHSCHAIEKCKTSNAKIKRVEIFFKKAVLMYSFFSLFSLVFSSPCHNLLKIQILTLFYNIQFSLCATFLSYNSNHEILFHT